jgi:hypothetical protein
MPLAIATSSRAAQSCPSQITSCGCVIDAPGEYKVTATLNQPAFNYSQLACIEVDAANVRLDLGGNLISLSGAPSQSSRVSIAPDPGIPNACAPSGLIIFGILPDIGIQLTRRATNAIVIGGGATISGFTNYGVEVESSGAIISNLNANNNTYGIVLNQAHGVQLTNIQASNNLLHGLSLIRSSGNQISGFTGNNNGATGILIFGPSDANRVTAFQASSNGCGVVIEPTSCGTSRGVRIGCVSHGGDGNTMTSGTTNGNTIYGIWLMEPSRSVVVDNTATMNVTFDLIDEANDCTHNLWFGNTFATSSPSACIH